MRSMKGFFFSTWVFRYHHCKYLRSKQQCEKRQWAVPSGLQSPTFLDKASCDFPLTVPRIHHLCFQTFPPLNTSTVQGPLIFLVSRAHSVGLSLFLLYLLLRCFLIFPHLSFHYHRFSLAQELLFEVLKGPVMVSWHTTPPPATIGIGCWDNFLFKLIFLLHYKRWKFVEYSRWKREKKSHP